MRLPIALDYRPALLSGAGIGRATRELVRALAARDDLAVHLFGHSLARARIATTVPAGARLHRLPIPGRLLPALARCGLGADRLAGRVPVFHWTDYVMPPLARARALLTVHDLAFVRDAAWHGPHAATLRDRTRAAIAAAAAVVVPSATTAADVRAFAPGTTVHVVPFGADHAPKPAAVPRGDHVLCLGTIEPRKNHLTLLRAFRLLPKGTARLVVVGRVGWQCDDIVRELAAGAAAGHWTWHQDLPDAALWPLFASARALVFPSWFEGFGFPPLEAMRLGLPVVAHDGPPMRELGDGVFTFADAADPAALADAIRRALKPGAAAAAAVAGPRRAADFTWARCAAAHAALYREVAAC